MFYGWNAWEENGISYTDNCLIIQDSYFRILIAVDSFYVEVNERRISELKFKINKYNKTNSWKKHALKYIIRKNLLVIGTSPCSIGEYIDSSPEVMSYIRHNEINEGYHWNSFTGHLYISFELSNVHTYIQSYNVFSNGYSLILLNYQVTELLKYSTNTAIFIKDGRTIKDINTKFTTIDTITIKHRLLIQNFASKIGASVDGVKKIIDNSHRVNGKLLIMIDNDTIDDPRIIVPLTELFEELSILGYRLIDKYELINIYTVFRKQRIKSASQFSIGVLENA